MSISPLASSNEYSVGQRPHLKRPLEIDSHDESIARLCEPLNGVYESFYGSIDSDDESGESQDFPPNNKCLGSDETLLGHEHRGEFFTATYDHSWERRLNAQKELKFSNANKMQSDERKLVVPVGLNPNRVMPSCDRNIPSREAMRISGAFETYHMRKPKSNYEKALAQVMFPNYTKSTLQFTPPKKYEPLPTRIKWEPPVHYYKRLEAPGFINEFYMNNFHWGKKLLGINLANTCYVNNLTTNEVKAVHVDNSLLTCLKWNPEATLLGLGNEHSSIGILNVETNSPILNFHFKNLQPTSCINWLSNTQFTAANHGYINHFDSRSKSLCWELDRNINTICSLEWSPDATCLARGGGDNKVEIFDIRNLSNGPVFSYSHLSTVKPLKWSTSSILFSGGLQSNGVLKVFSTKIGEVLCEKSVGDAIYSMESLTDNVVVIGLGYNALNNIQFWHYNSRKKNLKQIGETHMVMSPTGAPGTFSDWGKVLSLSKDPNSLVFGSVSNIQVLDLWRPDSFSSKSDSSKKELDGSSIFSPPTFR